MLDDLAQWLTTWVADLAQVSTSAIDPRVPLVHYGLDSVRACELAVAVGARVGRRLPATLAWEYPTIDALVMHLVCSQCAVAPAVPADREAHRVTQIAIVGMACRMPRAADLTAFWDLLRAGLDATRDIPRDRWNADDYYDADPAAPGKAIARRGAFLDHVDRFDPLFFSISPREAAELDPNQRLALELAWEALEDAGLPPATLAGTKTGVYLGSMWHDWADLTQADLAGMSSHRATGQAINMIANRVSYALGLRGPSMMIDTACSSAIVAIHLACQALAAGDASVALAGGVNHLLAPGSMVFCSKFGGLARDGRCKTFDARADGFARGEGGGIIVLKPLARAIRDGDPIYAVVRGSAVNNDGASQGLIAPNPVAQRELLEHAYARAGVAPSAIHYVEAHGTGTRIGDPIEVGVLGEVLGRDRPADQALAVGSVKSNIGHLEGAAGIAGVIKVVLAMRHRALPPSLHVEAPNPLIAFDELHVRVPTACEPWPCDDHEPAFAGVSAFGWGGTNAHVVLEGPPPPPAWRPGARAAGAPGGHRVALVCTPLGSQWVGMGRMLARTEPVFRAELARCDAAFLPVLGWSVLDEILGDVPAERFDDVVLVQPLLFSIQVALAAQWRAWGVIPEAVIGHSAGEAAAACIAGILTLDDAVQVVHHYSRVQRPTAGLGAMALVDAPAAEVEAALEPYRGQIEIAAFNSPRSTVVTGELMAIRALSSALADAGVVVNAIRSNVAGHSPLMAPALGELERALAGIRPRAPAIAMMSTVTADYLTGEHAGAAYWPRNLRQPVRFSDGLRRLLGDGFDVFVEIGPHPVLAPAIAELLGAAGRGAVVGSLRRSADERVAMATSRTQLDGLGVLQAQAADLAQLVTVSGRTPAAALAAATALGEALPPTASPADVAYTTGVRRAHHEHRVAVVGGSIDELRARLARAAPGAAAAAAPPRIAFVFSGQGSQWPQMARHLLEREPLVRDTIAACERALAPHVAWSLTDQLLGDGTALADGAVDVVQPVLWGVALALAALWRSWGIEPAAVIGHSMGEVAAACVTGALSLEDGARVIALRSRIVRAHASGRGAMAVVELSREAAARAIAGLEQRLAVGVSNGPRSSVLSGDAAALDEVLAVLERQGVFVRRVKVDYASHSPQMDPLLPLLIEALAPIAPRPARVPMFSTVTCAWIDGTALDAAYWAANLREPVRFAEAVAAIGDAVFVEISPHPLLTSAIGDAGAAAFGSLRRDHDERGALLETLGELYVRGAPVAFAALHPDGGRVVALPTYPWQRERYWIPNAAARAGAGTWPRPGAHPLLGLLGDPIAIRSHPGIRIWQGTLAADSLPWLADHRVHGAVVVPATAIAELACAAARSVGASATVHELELIEPIVLGDAPIHVQVTLERGAGGRLAFELSTSDDPGDPSSWRRHAAAAIEPGGAASAEAGEPVAVIRSRLTAQVVGEAFYDQVAARGIEYGPAFRRIERAWWSRTEVLAELAALPDPGGHAIHPVVLDAALHAALAAMTERRETLVPATIGRVAIYPGAADVRFSHVRLTSDPDGEITAEVRLCDGEGHPVCEVGGLRLRPMRGEPRAAPKLDRDWFLGLDWPVAPGRARPAQAATGWWIVDDRDGVAAAVAARLAARGAAVTRLASPAAVAGALGAASPHGVVYLAGLDLPAVPSGDPIAAAEGGVLGALAVVQALARATWRDRPRLFLVTRGAQDVGGAPVAPVHATLWGLGQTLIYEHPELHCTRIDVDPAAPSVDALADALVDELLGADAEDQIALRGDRRHVARLVGQPVPPPGDRPVVRADGCYLVTGGLGGLGLAVARWLVDRGARHLALLGRHGVTTDAQRDAIAALEAAGATVLIAAADVADRAQLAEVFATIDRGSPPLRGIIHAAGLLDDGVALQQDGARLRGVLAPKLAGAWHLHELAAPRPLDWFALYSSAAALIGSPGQSTYAAANGFLDGLAAWRRAQGLPAISIRWGAFAEVGLAARDQRRGARLAERGMPALTVEQGHHALERLLASESALAAVIPLDVRQWLEFHPAVAGSPLFGRLARGAAPRPRAGALRDAVAQVAPAERARVMERLVQDEIVRVLRVDPSRLHPDTNLTQLGLDSMMGLELRNRLENALGARLPATLAWTYPRIDALAAHLLAIVALPDPPGDAALVAARPVDELGADLHELSDQALMQLLADELAGGDGTEGA